jgi:hypothetical protein
MMEISDLLRLQRLKMFKIGGCNGNKKVGIKRVFRVR